ncbi:hypothetical protein J14TS2_41400 [Bacillus sp. J14TS2]|uniref:hypothetical protein n=1 Tax=Bacillus sp. J14TS2 TaxID=2807188 RepID=UPI001B2E30FC|nr:hypothetical protein [Bacillus sp. J14TS2]GIN73665.1 hypothetical protein J14TS2_41400 [Bacillus sp. J14TS2]
MEYTEHSIIRVKAAVSYGKKELTVKQFEYKVEVIQIQLKVLTDFEAVMTEKLNALGKEGWELSGVNGTAFYFKREILKLS